MGFILARRHWRAPTPRVTVSHNGLAAGRDRDVRDYDALLTRDDGTIPLAALAIFAPVCSVIRADE